jgi:RNA polymerase sigma factor (sigma-70 family)
MAATHERATLVLDLFDQYYERVYAFLRKSTTPDVAEDLAQEVFVRLLQHPTLERLTISISYLLKIAHNLLRRRYARATRLRELLEERAVMDGGESAVRTRSHANEAGAAGDIGSDVLETALGLLAKDEQDAIRMIVCEGWKHRGIVKLRKLVGSSMDSSMTVGRDEIIGLGARERSRFGRVDLSGDLGAPAQRGSRTGSSLHDRKRGIGQVKPTDEVA